MSTTTTRPTVNLYECDGNAFSIMARVRRAFRDAGRSAEWDAALASLTAGSYEQLLAAVYELCEVVYEAPPAPCVDCGERAIDEDGLCGECGHQHRTEECSECREHFPEGSLNHNSLCGDCEWDAYYAEQDEDEE